MKDYMRLACSGLSKAVSGRKPSKSGLASKLGNFAKTAVAAGMIYAGVMAPKSADADLIRVDLTGPIGSEMYIQHQNGGNLGWDGVGGEDVRWSTYLSGERPPGMGENDDWLWIYSDQVNQYHGVTDYELQKDNRPFDGPDTNQNFPLILDTQGPNSITSTNNYVQFSLQSGIDPGREFYHWSLTLGTDAGASWADGYSGSTKSGVWDLALTGGQDGTYDLPSYNLFETQGQYATLDILPRDVIPEPSTGALVVGGLAAAAALGRLRRARVSVA